VSRKDFETHEKKQERMQSDLSQLEIGVKSLKDTLSSQQTVNDQQANKLKEMNETLYKIDNVQIPTINTRLGQLPTKDDLTSLRRDNEQQVNRPCLIILNLIRVELA
jgi:hypothetical protein